nr:skin secretory protein xP2-like [Aegilops tauschii subsp. strangulata]
MRFQESGILLGTRRTVLKVLTSVFLPDELPGKNCWLYRCKNKDEFVKNMPLFDEWGPRPDGLEGPRENPVVVVPFLAPDAELAPSDGAGGRAPGEAGDSSAEEHVLSGDPGASSSGACHSPPEASVAEETLHVTPEAKAPGTSGGRGETFFRAPSVEVAAPPEKRPPSSLTLPPAMSTPSPLVALGTGLVEALLPSWHAEPVASSPLPLGLAWGLAGVPKTPPLVFDGNWLALILGSSSSSEPQLAWASLEDGLVSGEAPAPSPCRGVAPRP